MLSSKKMIIVAAIARCDAWHHQGQYIRGGNVRCSKVLTPLRSSTGEDSWVVALNENEGKDLAQDIWAKRDDLPEDPARTANRVFLEWLSTNGVYISEASNWGEAPHPLGLSGETYDENNDNEASGRGLIARKGVNDADQLFGIPLSLCLTKETARKELGKDVIPAATSEYIAIALLLCHERFVKGPESFWWPYFQVLPETADVNPSYTWSEEELTLLEGSPAIKATRSMQNKLRQEYATLFDPDGGLFIQRPDMFPGADASREAPGGPAAPFSFANFEWAFCMLFSRAIRLERLSKGEAVALVPYADLINHSPFSTAYISAQPGKKDRWFGDEPDLVVLYADRAFKKMEQLFISYGQKSNAELLLLYGFALDRNPFNSVEISLGLKRDELDDPDGSLYREKLAVLVESGRSNEQGQGLTFPLYNDRYPNELLECLRLLCLRTEDVTRSRTKERVPLPSIRLTTPVNDVNEALVFEAIIESCEVALVRYPTSEDDDTALVADRFMFSALPVTSRNAIRLRRSEKRLLKRTIASAERRLIEITSGGGEASVEEKFKPWLEKKTMLDGILDDIGVDLK